MTEVLQGKKIDYKTCSKFSSLQVHRTSYETFNIYIFTVHIFFFLRVESQYLEDTLTERRLSCKTAHAVDAM